MLSLIWTEQYGKKTGKRRKFEVVWNTNRHMSLNVRINCITFSLIPVLNFQAPEEVRIGLANSKYQKNQYSEDFLSTLLLALCFSKVFWFSFSYVSLKLIGQHTVSKGTIRMASIML